MEANTVSAVTELLVNILREKREEESAKRDAEYHEQRMKEYLK